MTIALRDYQEECLEAVTKEFMAGINRQLISLPTGSGKTVVMGALAKKLNKKTILLAHREELIDQAVEKFQLIWPKADIGICMADRDEIHKQVVIASVQSAFRPKRLARLKEQGFDLMMVDEAHHASAYSYQNVIHGLGFVDGSSKLLVGVSATVQRSDKLYLSNSFDRITFSRSIGTMIKAGYLSPVIGRKILTNFNFEKVRVRNGDFSVGDLSEAVNTPERNDFIVSKFKEYANDRKGVAFCCDVQHCKDLAEAFRKAGIKAEAVYGEMPTHERKSALESLKAGNIQVAISCGILTEGFDEPSIDVIVMARPTKSHGLYIQCIGRGLRLYPGKTNCFVLDFTDRGHNLDSIITLNNTIPEAIHLKEDGAQIKREEIDRTQKINAIISCDKEFDILGTARFIWIPIGNEEWSLIDDEKNEIVIRPQNNGYIADIFQNGSKTSVVSEPLPLEYCSGVCEDYARRHLKIAFADMNASWMNQATPPTEGQIRFLEKCGRMDPSLTKSSAAIEIRRIIAIRNKEKRAIGEETPTPAQQYALKSYGIDPEGMNKLQAMQRISEIKGTNNKAVR